MLSVLSAEAVKLSRHKATWFLVWIYPLGLLVLLLLGMAIDAAQPSAPSRPGSRKPPSSGWCRPPASGAT
jgi:ABC-2 type transport system permease protein